MSRATDTLRRLLELDNLRDAAGLQQPERDTPLRFGDVAVALGLCSRPQVEAAAAVQKMEANQGRRFPRICPTAPGAVGRPRRAGPGRLRSPVSCRQGRTWRTGLG